MYFAVGKRAALACQVDVQARDGGTYPESHGLLKGAVHQEAQHDDRVRAGLERQRTRYGNHEELGVVGKVWFVNTVSPSLPLRLPPICLQRKFCALGVWRSSVARPA